MRSIWIAAICALCAFSSNAGINWELYDDFDDNSFDTSKWDLAPDSQSPQETSGELKFRTTGESDSYVIATESNIKGIRADLKLSGNTTSSDGGVELLVISSDTSDLYAYIELDYEGSANGLAARITRNFGDVILWQTPEASYNLGQIYNMSIVVRDDDRLDFYTNGTLFATSAAISGLSDDITYYLMGTWNDGGTVEAYIDNAMLATETPDFTGDHHMEIQKIYSASSGTTTYEAFINLWPPSGRSFAAGTLIDPSGDISALENEGGELFLESIEYPALSAIKTDFPQGVYTVAVSYTDGTDEVLTIALPDYQAGDFPAHPVPENIAHGATGVDVTPTFEMGTQDWDWMEIDEKSTETEVFFLISSASQVTVSPPLEGGKTYVALFDDNDSNGNYALGSAYRMEFDTADAGNDVDGDGLPNNWEQQYFGSYTGAVAGMDSDGDGMVNSNEYVAGTHPLDPQSFFGVTAFERLNDGSGFVVEWNALSNRYYDVLWSTNLENDFELLSSDLEYPKNSYTDTVHGVDPKIFYRIDVRLKQ